MSDYTCEQCGGRFTQSVPDSLAWDEALDTWKPADLNDVVMVCDDCYWAMLGVVSVQEHYRRRAAGVAEADLVSDDERAAFNVLRYGK